MELFNKESKLEKAQQFILGIGQKFGALVKIQVMACKCDYFFLVVNKNGTLYKYKLRKSHIMSLVLDQILEIQPKIPRLKTIVSY